ncbi:hypothetical protein [Mycobacterium kiyosense]|nr:hypothetical protein IWGMT90018_37440 [Mycobacterium kiyosense]
MALQGIKERADRVIENLEERKINGLAALDELKAIAEEKDKLREFARQSGLSDRAFGIFSALRTEHSLRELNVDIQRVAVSIEVAVDQFPHWRQNPDERRRLRSGLYKPLLDSQVPAKSCAEIIDNVMTVLEKV